MEPVVRHHLHLNTFARRQVDWFLMPVELAGRQAGRQSGRQLQANWCRADFNSDCESKAHSTFSSMGPRRAKVKCTRYLHKLWQKFSTRASQMLTEIGGGRREVGGVKFARWLWTWTNRQIFNLPQAKRLSTDRTRVLACLLSAFSMDVCNVVVKCCKLCALCALCLLLLLLLLLFLLLLLLLSFNKFLLKSVWLMRKFLRKQVNNSKFGANSSS